MMVHANDVGPVVVALMNAQCYSATQYLTKKLVIRATHPRYHSRKKQWDKRDTRLDLRLTIGAPNYHERAFIKKHGLPDDIQLRDFPKPR